MKKTQVKKVQVKKNQSLALSEIQLTERQIGILNQPTPKEFIKERAGRGGKTVKFVEGGYVISRLNEIFGVLNWEFINKQQGINDKQVWVLGTLTIIDHKKGYRVSKETYGQHKIEENVPLGDTLKAANTDCLKKCASMFGIALDVYWKDSEQVSKGSAKASAKNDMTKEELIANTLTQIKKCENVAMLQNWLEQIYESKKLNKAEQTMLTNQINNRIDVLINAASK